MKTKPFGAYRSGAALFLLAALLFWPGGPIEAQSEKAEEPQRELVLPEPPPARSTRELEFPEEGGSRPDYRVSVSGGRLEVELRKADLGRVLKDIGRQAGFEVNVGAEAAGKKLSTRFGGRSLERGLIRIFDLVEITDYTIIYGPEGSITELHVLGNKGLNGGGSGGGEGRGGSALDPRFERRTPPRPSRSAPPRDDELAPRTAPGQIGNLPPVPQRGSEEVQEEPSGFNPLSPAPAPDRNVDRKDEGSLEEDPFIDEVREEAAEEQGDDGSSRFYIPPKTEPRYIPPARR